jgi:hypothetical protein
VSRCPFIRSSSVPAEARPLSQSLETVTLNRLFLLTGFGMFRVAIGMKITATPLSAAEIRRAFSWVDLVVLFGVFGLAWTILHFGQGMIVHFDESQSTEISTNILNIPYYAGRTVLRMWAIWRTLTLPAIFPFWVTGACTAAGGAWNAPRW